jgi:hypothetical protein
VTVTLLPSFFNEGLLGTASTVGVGPVVAPEVQAQSVASATAAAARPRVFGEINEASTVAAAGAGVSPLIAARSRDRQNKCKMIR